MTLSDAEAKRRGTKKVVMERSHDPAFQYAYEIQSKRLVTIVDTIDDMLTGT